jgi:hypothetical protein
MRKLAPIPVQREILTLRWEKSLTVLGVVPGTCQLQVPGYETYLNFKIENKNFNI